MLDPVAEVFERVAARYDQGIPFFAVFGRELVRWTRLGAGQQVLDLGAGAGAVTIPAAAAVGPAGRVVAADLVPAMLARITTLALPNVDTLQLNALDLTFADDSFDVTLSGFLLHLLPDRVAALREISRVLRPDGELAFSVPGPSDDGGWWARYGEIVAQFGARVDGPDGFQGSGASWEESAAAAGFSVAGHARRQVSLAVAGPEAYWDWLLSHGTRWIYDALPESDRGEFRGAVLHSLRAAHPTAGSRVIAGAELWRLVVPA